MPAVIRDLYEKSHKLNGQELSTQDVVRKIVQLEGYCQLFYEICTRNRTN
jgi:hypothetical protein